MSMKHKFNGFDLKVTQVVPGMEWSLIPSPLLQVNKPRFTLWKSQIGAFDGLFDWGKTKLWCTKI